MKVGLDDNTCPRAKRLGRFLRPVLALPQLVREVDTPVRKRALQGCDPFWHPRFTGVDLLTGADQTDDDGPVFMAIHAGDQELGSDMPKSETFFRRDMNLEVCSGSMPAVLRRQGRVRPARLSCHVLISEVVDVLDEGLHYASAFHEVSFSPVLRRRCARSRASASDRTLTSGPFPER